MNTITKEIEVHSEYGEKGKPAFLTIVMNGKTPECPVTFYENGKAVFSMGTDEIPDFIQAVKSLDCSG